MRKLQDLRIRAYAKVNLFLNVIGKREDGYHNLETVFQSIGLYDDIIISERPNKGIIVQCNHPDVPSGQKNLAYKAAQSLNDIVGGFSGVEISIEKRIPVSAGLGGGSANAAAVLLGINELFSFKIGIDTLMDIGSYLGADVPFCILGGTAFGTGIGDILTPLQSIPDIPLVLINPGLPISTADIFSNLHIPLTKQTKESIIIKNCVEKGDIDGIGNTLFNVLEIPVFSKHPVLLELKTQLSTQVGSLGALMSGSGSTIFALMRDISAADRCQTHFNSTYSFCMTTKTSPVGVHIYN